MSDRVTRTISTELYVRTMRLGFCWFYFIFISLIFTQNTYCFRMFASNHHPASSNFEKVSNINHFENAQLVLYKYSTEIDFSIITISSHRTMICRSISLPFLICRSCLCTGAREVFIRKLPASPLMTLLRVTFIYLRTLYHIKFDFSIIS